MVCITKSNTVHNEICCAADTLPITRWRTRPHSLFCHVLHDARIFTAAACAQLFVPSVINGC